MRRVRQLRNAAEQACVDELRSRGITPHHRGYPDFWWVDENGTLHLVEVKPTSGFPLKAEQREFLEVARRHGCKAYRFDPDRGLREQLGVPTR